MTVRPLPGCPEAPDLSLPKSGVGEGGLSLASRTSGSLATGTSPGTSSDFSVSGADPIITHLLWGLRVVRQVAETFMPVIQRRGTLSMCFPGSLE